MDKQYDYDTDVLMIDRRFSGEMTLQEALEAYWQAVLRSAEVRDAE